MRKLIEEYNDLLSQKYDEATQGEFSWTAPKKLEEHIRPFIKKDMDVLDIGVGTGQTAEIFLAHNCRVTGIDISNEMLTKAKAKYAFQALFKHDIEDGLAKLLPNETFDIIVAIGVLEFVKDVKNVLKEMRQLLKENGLIAFTYEVFDPENKIGIEKEAPLKAGLANAPDLLSFMVFRRLPDEIDQIIKELNLNIVSREKYVAYLRSQQKIPVLYEIIVAK